MIRRLSSKRKTSWTKSIWLVGLVFLTSGCVLPGMQKVVKESTPPANPREVLPTLSFSQSQPSSPSAKPSFQSMIGQEEQSTQGLAVDVEWKSYENKEFGYKLSYPGNPEPRDQGMVNDKVLHVTAFVGLGGKVGFTIKITTESFESLAG